MNFPSAWNNPSETYSIIRTIYGRRLNTSVNNNRSVPSRGFSSLTTNAEIFLQSKIRCRSGCLISVDFKNTPAGQKQIEIHRCKIAYRSWRRLTYTFLGVCIRIILCARAFIQIMNSIVATELRVNIKSIYAATARLIKSVNRQVKDIINIKRRATKKFS